MNRQMKLHFLALLTLGLSTMASAATIKVPAPPEGLTLEVRSGDVKRVIQHGDPDFMLETTGDQGSNLDVVALGPDTRTFGEAKALQFVKEDAFGIGLRNNLECKLNGGGDKRLKITMRLRGAPSSIRETACEAPNNAWVTLAQFEDGADSAKVETDDAILAFEFDPSR